MATFTLDKPEAVRKVVERIADTRDTLAEDAKVLTAKAGQLLDEGKLAAGKAYARTVRDLEDARDEAALKVRKAPIAAVGITFGVGLLVGVALGWVARRPRA